MLSRDSRQEQKLKAIRRAQFRLAQRLAAIDWENDVLMPEIEALKAGKPVLGLGEATAFEVIIEDHHSPAPSPDAGE
jgi:hypothetical protein